MGLFWLLSPILDGPAVPPPNLRPWGPISPLGIVPGWARPCTLRSVRVVSSSTYSPCPLNEKLVPSKVTKWGSPKAEAEVRVEDQVDFFGLSHPGMAIHPWAGTQASTYPGVGVYSCGSHWKGVSSYIGDTQVPRDSSNRS